MKKDKQISPDNIQAIIAILDYIGKELPASFKISAHLIAAARLSLLEEAQTLASQTLAPKAPARRLRLISPNARSDKGRAGR